MAVIQIRMIYFLHFKLFCENIKSSRDNDVIFSLVKTQNLTWDFVQIPATCKRYLAELGLLANIQNNSIKLSGFRLDVTRLLHWENFLNPEIFFAFLYGQPRIPLFLVLSAQCIVLVTRFSMGRPKFTDEIIKRVVVYI